MRIINYLIRENHDEDEFYCQFCDIAVDEKTKHCHRCNACVKEFDHHCVWVNHCVGEANYSKFVQFTASILALSLVGVLTQLWVFYLGKDIVKRAILVSSFLVNSITSGILVKLLYFHFQLKKKRMTTYEWILEKRKEAGDQAVSSEQRNQTNNRPSKIELVDHSQEVPRPMNDNSVLIKMSDHVQNTPGHSPDRKDSSNVSGPFIEANTHKFGNEAKENTFEVEKVNREPKNEAKLNKTIEFQFEFSTSYQMTT